MSVAKLGVITLVVTLFVIGCIVLFQLSSNILP